MKFLVTKQYTVYLTAEVEAEDEDEAKETVDQYEQSDFDDQEWNEEDLYAEEVVS